jgi:peptidoglycan/xylan/chitin deacetylase (PgdA/CDA1 family)
VSGASRLAYWTVVGSGTARVFRHLNRARVPVLMYHGLHAGEIDPLVNFDGLHLHVDRFARQMEYLARHYTVVPLAEALGASARPGRVVITFDDGYASMYRHGYPVLKTLGLPATLFVATSFVEGGAPMWWDRLRLALHATRTAAITVRLRGGAVQLATHTRAAKAATLARLHALLRPLPPAERNAALDDLDGARRVGAAPYEPATPEQLRAMAEDGISIQSHGVTHEPFGSLSSAAIAAELRASKATVERWTGRAVEWFAYPFGDVDARAAALLAPAGYAGAVSCRETLSRPGDDRFAIPRVAVGDPISGPQFIAALSGLRDVTGVLKRAMSAEVPA